MPRIVNKLQKYKAIFLLAPAGWGKTTLVFKLFQKNKLNILFVSPLKALEKEVEEKAAALAKEDFFFKALTAERVNNFLDTLTRKERNNLLIIFDEIHLWNFWGSRFRYRLWECFYRIANEGLPMLCLSATLRQVYEKEWRDLLKHGGYDFQLLDFGNGKTQNPPSSELSFHGLPRSQFIRRMSYELDKKKSSIIFCKYREEVERLCGSIQKTGLQVRSCVGGESLKFMEACNENGYPQVIVCTSALSHGVNLGNIENVFVTYDVEDWDLYLQMVARGGRKGGGFEVFSHRKKKASLWNKFKIMVFDRYLQLFYA